MENNYETLRMPELKALTRECRLRGYSWLRIADLIAFLQNNEHQVRSAGEAQTQRPPPPPPQMSPQGCPQGVLLGNCKGNHRLKRNNPN